MKVNEIIKTTATLLAREDVVDYLSNTDLVQEVEKNTLETIDLLTRLCNLVISELAEGLIVMKKEISINNLSSVTFKDLAIEPIDVIAVYDASGNKLNYTVSAYGLTVSTGLVAKIEYAYLPKNYGLTDTVGTFEKKVTVGVLAYGVAAEFCIVEGRFDEAVMWNERYTSSINALITPKNAQIKGRNFL